MPKTFVFKFFVLLFSFGLMGLFVAYRSGAFESEPDVSNAPLSGTTENSSDKDNATSEELLPTSKSTFVVEPTDISDQTLVNPLMQKSQPLNLSEEELFILSSSKSTAVFDPASDLKIFFPALYQTVSVSDSSPVTPVDSIQKPATKSK